MTSLTRGIHHIGLTVQYLERSAHFFTQVLGWQEVKRNPDYPAIYVTDGDILLTLWQVQTDAPTSFDRKTQVGLHHLALKVDSAEKLDEIFELLITEQLKVEFPPKPVCQGPEKHMMCYEPSGIRIEIFWPG
ncbi:VOC family protein [Catenovulum sp. SM1970]|uniref:VOC family protein n=1 Tax=Marinifaba aquimaris TaxID=2741323 RepID=UPI0015736396|nr:VOC family protein [Marinifaba aquimaris]NTS76253.1 VOC family protein [Marinifaba aquimaris]